MYEFVGREGYYREAVFNLYLLGQRWCDSEAGRFISRDPIGEKGGINLYEYVRNNVVNLVDPKSKGGLISEVSDLLYSICMELKPGETITVGIPIFPTPNPCLWIGVYVYVKRTNNPWFPCIYIPIPFSAPIQIDPCCLIN